MNCFYQKKCKVQRFDKLIIVLLLSILLFDSCKKEDSVNENTESNTLPYKPSVYITGPTQGSVNNLYEFHIHNWRVGYTYIFDWGDGTIKEEASYGLYGGPDLVKHKWTQAGVFKIKIKEKNNETYKESQWSDPYIITITDNNFTMVYKNNFTEAYGKYVIQTEDGGFLIIGDTKDTYIGDFDIVILKTNNKGEEQWRKFIGQPTINDYVISATHISNEIVILSNNGIYKTNYNGDVILFKQGQFNNGDRIINSNGGGFILSGSIYSSYSGYTAYVSKLNDSFVEQWLTYVSNNAFTMNVVEEDNGYLAVLLNYQRLAKLDPNGNVLWVKNLLSNQNSSSHKWHLIKTDDQHYIACGTYPGYGNNTVGVIKIDTSGNVVFNKTSGTMLDVNTIAKTSDNAFVIGGDIYSSYLPPCLIYKKISFNGDEIWSKEYISTTLYFYGSVDDIKITSDNGLALTGVRREYSKSNEFYFIYLMKTDEYGNAPIP